MRYRELDALRGFAAVSVVLFHLTMGQPISSYGFYLGVAGVDLFFMISGFVIFMSLSSNPSIPHFIIHRASRLYPAYWVCVAITAVLLWLVGSSELPTDRPLGIVVAGNLTMLQHFMGIPSVEYVYWTLTVEIIFYLLMALLLGVRLLPHTATICWIISIAAAAAFNLLPGNPHVAKVFSAVPLLSFAPLFTAGICFFKIHASRKASLVSILMVASCLPLQVLLFSSGGQSRFFMSQWEYAVILLMCFLAFTLFALGRLGFIVNPASLFLGRISYPLYLIHCTISINVLVPLLQEKFKMPFLVASLAICLPLTLLAATLITKYIEDPLRSWMRRKLLSLVSGSAQQQ